MSWGSDQPIYRQLRAQTVASILEGSLAEGELLPSVRQVAVALQVNPLTVSKAYQALVDEGLVAAERGIGMRVCHGARAALIASEREHFLQQEWPKLADRLRQLNLSLQDLLDADPHSSHNPKRVQE